MKNVLITGGAGFIGSNFVRYLLDKYKNVNVVVYDKLTYAGNRENLAPVARDPRLKCYEGDICNVTELNTVIQRHAVNTIVNFAAETHVDRSLTEGGGFVQTNDYGVFVLLEAAKKYRVSRFHQVGTDEVYGEVLEGRSCEIDPLQPRSPYAASKAAADLMCMAYYESFGLPVTITRGSNTIGPYQYPEKVVPLFITNAIDNQPLPLYGDGSQMRDYQYVKDHCAGIDMVLHQGKPGQIYNLGTEIETTNIELARLILQLLGKPEMLIQSVPDRPGHDRRYALDCDKIRALGWRNQYNFEQAIEATVKWYVDNEVWWRKIKDGSEFQSFYQKQYQTSY